MEHGTAAKILQLIVSAADAVSILKGTDGAAAARLIASATQAVEAVISTSERRARAARAARKANREGRR